ncbi:glycosyltransferase family 2 protein [uncultured Bacteroides sp.]|uniref:glycosyltransferase family 2 protein n=1 Tax=uncultured Bacteroides sp. TaxID=162156 RepID=UPI00261E26C1|nr:glycosyltransferase family 2 protein [uncultured Bacteroides sp.]
MISNEILFSVVIPTYNRANLIKRCIESVVRQTYQNWEALIVDNYSDDNTAEIISSFHDERIRYYKNHNYGVISVSRNFALEKSNGDWICFLDSDDYWASNKLERLLPYLNDFDIIYHGYESNMVRRLLGNSRRLFYTVKEPAVAYVLQRGDPFNPTCTAVSKFCIGDIRFSEDKDLYAIEDYDFFLQLLLKHPRIKHLKEYLAFYDVTTGVSHNQKEHLNRSRLIYLKYKHLLTKNEFRNVLKLYMFLRGVNYIHTDLKKACKYLKIGVYSDVKEVRLLSCKWLLIAYIFRLLDIFRT